MGNNIVCRAKNNKNYSIQHYLSLKIPVLRIIPIHAGKVLPKRQRIRLFHKHKVYSRYKEGKRQKMIPMEALATEHQYGK